MINRDALFLPSPSIIDVNSPFMEEVVKVHDRFFVPFLSEAVIQQRVTELAWEINDDYADTPPLLLVILNGAFMFAADLFRQLTCRPEIQFIRIASYGDQMVSSQTAKLLLNLDTPLEGRKIIIIEDIIETGRTISFLRQHIGTQGVASLKVMTLLYKPEQQKEPFKPDYIGFSIPPAFVVGYGLDYAQQGRELRAIYQLKGA